MPTAAYAEFQGDKLRITAMVAKPDGSEIYRIVKLYDSGNPIAAGESVAAALLDTGAAQILETL